MYFLIMHNASFLIELILLISVPEVSQMFCMWDRVKQIFHVSERTHFSYFLPEVNQMFPMLDRVKWIVYIPERNPFGSVIFL